MTAQARLPARVDEVCGGHRRRGARSPHPLRTRERLRTSAEISSGVPTATRRRAAARADYGGRDGKAEASPWS